MVGAERAKKFARTEKMNGDLIRQLTNMSQENGTMKAQIEDMRLMMQRPGA